MRDGEKLHKASAEREAKETKAALEILDIFKGSKMNVQQMMKILRKVEWLINTQASL